MDTVEEPKPKQPKMNSDGDSKSPLNSDGLCWKDDHKRILDIVNVKMGLEEIETCPAEIDERALSELKALKTISKSDFHRILNLMDLLNQLRDQFPKPNIIFLRTLFDFFKMNFDDDDNAASFKGQFLRSCYKLLEEWPMHSEDARWYWIQIFSVFETENTHTDEAIPVAITTFRKMLLDIYGQKNLPEDRNYSIDWIEFITNVLEIDYAGVLLRKNFDFKTSPNGLITIECISELRHPLVYLLLCSNPSEEARHYYESLDVAIKLLQKWIEIMQDGNDFRTRAVYGRIIGLCLDSLAMMRNYENGQEILSPKLCRKIFDKIDPKYVDEFLFNVGCQWIRELI